MSHVAEHLISKGYSEKTAQKIAEIQTEIYSDKNLTDSKITQATAQSVSQAIADKSNLNEQQRENIEKSIINNTGRNGITNWDKFLKENPNITVSQLREALTDLYESNLKEINRLKEKQRNGTLTKQEENGLKNLERYQTNIQNNLNDNKLKAENQNQDAFSSTLKELTNLSGSKAQAILSAIEPREDKNKARDDMMLNIDFYKNETISPKQAFTLNFSVIASATNGSFNEQSKVYPAHELYALERSILQLGTRGNQQDDIQEILDIMKKYNIDYDKLKTHLSEKYKKEFEDLGHLYSGQALELQVFRIYLQEERRQYYDEIKTKDYQADTDYIARINEFTGGDFKYRADKKVGDLFAENLEKNEKSTQENAKSNDVKENNDYENKLSEFVKSLEYLFSKADAELQTR